MTALVRFFKGHNDFLLRLPALRWGGDITMPMADFARRARWVLAMPARETPASPNPRRPL
jgi:hypothetical protein